MRDSKRHGLQPYPFRTHQHLNVLIVLGDTLGVSWIFPRGKADSVQAAAAQSQTCQDRGNANLVFMMKDD